LDILIGLSQDRAVSQLSTVISVSSLASSTDRAAFREINEEWISRLFTLTDEDRLLLSDPEGRIVEPGGDVLIAHDARGAAVGCIALIPYGDGVFELAKMGVTPRSQGAGTGRRLIGAAIRRAGELGGRRIFLGTNSRLEAAVHLYEAAGFQRITRDRLPVENYYARADILMELTLD
jgi:putative acetyltransferase